MKKDNYKNNTRIIVRPYASQYTVRQRRKLQNIHFMTTYLKLGYYQYE